MDGIQAKQREEQKSEQKSACAYGYACVPMHLPARLPKLCFLHILKVVCLLGVVYGFLSCGIYSTTSSTPNHGSCCAQWL